jgi:hypothetical protein
MAKKRKGTGRSKKKGNAKKVAPRRKKQAKLRARKSAPKAKSPAKKTPVKKLTPKSGALRTLTSATLAAPKQLSSGATVPSNSPPAVYAALNAVAAAHNVDPAAIAGIIYVESVWSTTCGKGTTYIGLTQVGPDFLQYLGLTADAFLALSAADQITNYGKWLDYYKFNAQMAQYKIVPTALSSLGEQAALLQGMQFSPNGSSWKIALAAGDTSVPTTNTKQANVLGDTSIGDMKTYYDGLFRQYPPVYA